jgi:hypothetical protein
MLLSQGNPHDARANGPAQDKRLPRRLLPVATDFTVSIIVSESVQNAANGDDELVVLRLRSANW